RMKLPFVAAFALLVFPALGNAESAYDKIVSHSRIRAKKEGPNVCALQQVQGTKKKYFSTCRNWYRKMICGKTAVYECCPGYTKLDGMQGCPAVAPVDHVYNTLGLVKATSTQKYSDISKLRPEIEGPGSFTFFAPSNEAWEALDEVSALISNVNIELYNALHYHMVNKRLLTKDLKNNRKVTSMYNDLGLYINHYSNGVVTVNCARIIYGNQVATNGVVHVIDRVISAVGNTIRDVLEVDDDLTTLSDMAQTAGLTEMLGQPGHYTLFAPTNDAFDSLGGDVLERLQMVPWQHVCLVKFHLLDSIQCAEAILAGSSYVTMEGNTIEIGCDGDSITVNGVKMVLKKDIVTTNGVIHLIEKVLMPDSAKVVMELLGKEQSMFTDNIAKMGLSAGMRSDSEYTLLAPINFAFTAEVKAMDQRSLKFILENHILKTKVTLGQLYNGQRLETIGGKILRVFIYRAAVCIENSCLIRGSREGSNGALHLTKTLLKPAEKTMFEILKANGSFKIFLSLMEAAGLTDLLKQEGDFTLFAPSDMAFAGLSTRDLDLFKSDVQALRNILLYHITNGIFIGDGMEPRVTNLFKSIQGTNLKVTLANNSMQVNSVLVPESDQMATNGVVHFVNHLLYPEDVPVGNQELQMLLRRIITYMQIRYMSGFRYKEIPLTFIKVALSTQRNKNKHAFFFAFIVPSMTKVTRVIQGQPSVTKVTRVIEGQPSITKVTRVIEGEPSITKVTRVIEGEPSITKVTRVIEGEPSITKVTRVIEGEPIISKVTRVVQGKYVLV
uniref:Periostin, osteoblast specific factor b n=1 Tax=Anabas testudineus TaxID=64144 RepID=A0A7N6BFC8_ANATE